MSASDHARQTITWRIWFSMAILISVIYWSTAPAVQLAAQEEHDEDISAMAVAANSLQSSNGIPPFLETKPLASSYTHLVHVTSFFDHGLPVYETEQLAGVPADLRDSTSSRLVNFMNDQLTVDNNNVTLGYNSYSGHDGIDYAALPNTEVRAPADGVILIGAEATIGQNPNQCLVWIGHDLSDPVDNQADASTVYMHLSAIGNASSEQLKRPDRNSNSPYWIKGDRIRKGELIGSSGSDPCGGGSTGPHLHFGVAAGTSNRTSPIIYDPFGWWSSAADPWTDKRLSGVSGLYRKPSASSWAWAAAALPTASQPGYQGADVLAMTDDTDAGFQLFAPSARRANFTALLPNPSQQIAPIGTGAWTSPSLKEETNSQKKNWAVWGLVVPATGEYTLQAHMAQLPAGQTATHSAHYIVAYPDSQGQIVRWDAAALDQQGGNTWANIVQPNGQAAVTLQADSVALVALSDVTGTANERVIFDAIRLKAVGSVNVPADPARTIPIGLVIDNSSSMVAVGKIDAVKATLPPWIDQLTALNVELAFGLEAFANNNPPVQKTDDPEQIKTLIASLSGNDNGIANGECPEESLGAIRLLAPEVAGGQMLLFTDDVPFAPDQGKLAALQDLTRNSVKIHAIILPKTCNFGAGNDPSGFDAYRYLTTNTGGTYQSVPTSQTADALKIVLNEIRADAQLPTGNNPALNGLATTGASTSQIVVDGTVTKLNVLLNILSGAPTLTLTRPNGSTVTAGPGTTITITQGAIYYSINAPAVGVWQAAVAGTGEYTLSSSVETNLQFSYLGELQASLGRPMEILAHLAGPVSSTTFSVEMTTGQRLPISLSDNGHNNDAIAGDGVYSGYFTPTVAGTAHLRIDGKTTGNATFSRSDTRLIRILPLTLDAPPATMIVAGESVTLTFAIKNLGADSRSFALSATVPEGWTSTGLPASVVLPAGGQQALTIVVTPPANMVGSGLEPITLTAVAADDATVMLSAQTSLSLIPGNGPTDPIYYNQIPLVRR